MDAEVEAYVSQHWSHFAWVFNNFAGRKGHAELISVYAHNCERRLGIPACSFDVTARYPNSDPITRTMWSQFEWDERGDLHDALIVVETRRPR